MSSRSTRKFARLTMQAIAIDWPNLISRIPDATRQIPARTGVSASTVVKWMQGCTKPSGDNVILLMQEFAEFCDGALERANRKGTGLSQTQLRNLREVIAQMERQ